MRARKVTIRRKTRETDIELKLVIDGSGKAKLNTGIGFLDHGLELFAKHGFFDLNIKAHGDLDVDIHHTNEDIAIVLGQAFKQALGNMRGIKRYGFFYLPMEEALVRVVLDISGRPALFMNRPRIGKVNGYGLKDLYHFLQAFTRHIGLTLHIEILYGEDPHHIMEAVFKGLAKALDCATAIEPRQKDIASTKGII